MINDRRREYGVDEGLKYIGVELPISSGKGTLVVSKDGKNFTDLSNFDKIYVSYFYLETKHGAQRSGLLCADNNYLYNIAFEGVYKTSWYDVINNTGHMTFINYASQKTLTDSEYSSQFRRFIKEGNKTESIYARRDIKDRTVFVDEIYDGSIIHNELLTVL